MKAAFERVAPGVLRFAEMGSSGGCVVKRIGGRHGDGEVIGFLPEIEEA